MDSNEILKQRQMTYFELVDYLLKKYGKIKEDFFVNEKCKTTNPKIKKGNEGLFVHHIDEYRAIMLSNTEYALKYPFEYQKAERLVYCNYLEHLLLHIKITLEYGFESSWKKNEFVGFGGAFNFIIPEINDYFCGYQYKHEWRIKAFEIIKDNLSDYVEILKSFLEAFNIANECIDERYDPLTVGDLTTGKMITDDETILNVWITPEVRSVLTNKFLNRL